MTTKTKIFSISNLCRICLTQSENLVSMDTSVDSTQDSPTILGYLEQVLSGQIKMHSEYPKDICRGCVDRVKFSYDLQIVFLKSQTILEKYVTLNDIILPEENYLLDSEDVVGHISEDLEEKRVQQVPGRSSQSLKVELLGGNTFVVKKVSTKPLPKCRYCHKRFPSVQLVKKHLSVCKSAETHRCEYCSCQFPTLSAKRFHLKMRHSELIGLQPPEYECDICHEIFLTSNARAYHKVTRHNTSGKHYTCNVCNKSFVIKNSYNQHMEIHNKDVSKVVCPVCGKGFHYRGGLFYHMKVHNNERDYACSYCDKKFLNMTSLKRHTRTHTGERPYVCSYCSKSFCSISEVKTHERRHTGNKPHKCRYCGKSYISLWNLKYHMGSHPGNHPCDFCKRMFLDADVLKLHMEFKHKDKLESGVKEEIEENPQEFMNLIYY